ARILSDGPLSYRAVDAHEPGHERLCFLDSERLGDWRQNLFHFSGDDGLYLIGGDRLVVPAFAYRRGDSRRRLDAEIGANERILDFIEHRLVEPTPDHQIADSTPHRGGRPPETSTEPLPPPLLLARLIVHIVLVRSGSRS